MPNELRLALRRLRQAPLFTSFAIVTLSLAIGITTAVYSLLRAGLQTETGADEVDRLMLVGSAQSLVRSPGATRVSWPDYLDFSSQTTTLAMVGAWSPFRTALVAHGVSELTDGEAVSGTYFRTVGIQPVRGRLLDQNDDRPGAPLVGVLSAAAWRDRFGLDPDIVGATVKVGGQAFQIVGIAPLPFRGVDRPRGFGRPAIWVPLSTAGLIKARSTRVSLDRRDHAWLSIVGRLAPGRDKSAAMAEFATIAGRIDTVTPLPEIKQTNGAYRKQPRGWSAVGAAERIDFTAARDASRIVLLLPILVLLVACTNLMNFALSRGVARQHEFGVCRAIGASRWQLMRGQIVEYALVAGAAAIGAAFVANRLLAVVASTLRSLFGDVPEYRVATSIDGHVLTAVGVAGLLSFLVAGLLPALQLTGKSLRASLASDQATQSLPRWRGRSNLIALQVSVSVALLLVSALCVRQLPKLKQDAESGLSLDRVALVNVPFEHQAVDEPRTRHTIDRLLKSLATMQSIGSAAIASDRVNNESVAVAPEGQPIPEGPRGSWANVQSISPAYLETVALRLVAGRVFDDRDSATSEPAAIINESLARSLFGAADVVGRRITTGRSTFRDTDRTYRIVGVAGDIHSRRGTVEHALFVPFAQRFERVVPIEVLARATDGSDAGALAAQVREALRRVDPDVAVGFVGRADAPDFGPRKVLNYFVLIFGALAFLALAFAMSGLYGVLSHIVARRTRELGVRAALGADRSRLVRLVFRDGSRPVIEGILIGFGMAAGARLSMQPWFTEPVTAVDPVALVIALVPLLVAAALACYFPARRASRVDPNVALRHL